LKADGSDDYFLVASKALMLAGLTGSIWLYEFSSPSGLPDAFYIPCAFYISCFLLALILMGHSHRKLPLMLILGFATGLAFEVIGVATGLPFGRYRYVALDTARILNVPVVVPIMWGVFSAMAYLAARPFAKGLKLVLLASSLMVILDLALDPAMISWQAWVWEGGWGPTWHGVPLSNFAGWFLVSLVIIGLYELVLKGDGAEDMFFPLIYIYDLALIAVQAPENAGLLALSLGLTVISLLFMLTRPGRHLDVFSGC